MNKNKTRFFCGICGEMYYDTGTLINKGSNGMNYNIKHCFRCEKILIRIHRLN